MASPVASYAAFLSRRALTIFGRGAACGFAFLFATRSKRRRAPPSADASSPTLAMSALMDRPPPDPDPPVPAFAPRLYSPSAYASVMPRLSFLLRVVSSPGLLDVRSLGAFHTKRWRSGVERRQLELKDAEGGD
eukprot:31212-Pelagococcus_subviridis.AAC.11